MKFFGIMASILLFCSCDIVKHAERRAEILNSLEDKIMDISSENRDLKLKEQSYLSDINQLKNKNYYLQVQLDKLKISKKKKQQRKLASLSNVKNDLVKFDIYKWSPKEVLAVATDEFDKKHYEKSAQYFQVFSDQYREDEAYTDSFLFQAGMASFESKKYYEWSINHFTKLVDMYPTSKFLRGAKLWRSLAYLKLGKSDLFFKSAEEFRKKYRNTSEWRILSPHYEKIVQRHK